MKNVADSSFVCQCFCKPGIDSYDSHRHAGYKKIAHEAEQVLRVGGEKMSLLRNISNMMCM